MIRLGQEDQKLIGLLITPSWLSGIAAVVIGLLITVGVLAAFSANISPVQRQLVAWQQNQPKSQPAAPSATSPDNKPSLQNSWPLLLVWGFIGLIVYGISTIIIHSLSQAKALRESLDYVNAHPNDILKNTTEHIILRVVAAIGLGALVSVFFKIVIPYSITAAHASAVEILSLTGFLYALLSFLIVVVSLHLQTIFLRLALGKIRIFSESV